MKDVIISAFIIIGALWGAKTGIKTLHDTVKKAALEKAAKGLPPLAPFTRELTKTPQKRKH